MTQIETNSAIKQYRDRCEDRIEVLSGDSRTVLIVADGAGGVGSGDIAAESVVRAVKSNFDSIHSANEWVGLLREIDNQISAGQSTAAVVDIRPFGIAGASVGDSQVWILNGDDIDNLTANQNRKPLLGSGNARPMAFTHQPLDGILLAATDGFYDYAKRDDIIQTIMQSEFCEIARKCIDLVKLPSGDMWDDVGIIAARCKPPSRSRAQYDI